MRFHTLLVRILVAMLWFGTLPMQAKAAPASDYWAMWDQSVVTNVSAISHEKFADFLSRYVLVAVPGDVRVNYGGVTPADRDLLLRYVGELAAIDPRAYRREEQEAYWINLYNAITLRLVIENYPVTSIRDVDSWFKRGPWGKTVVEVAGTPLSLNDIEHRILRPIFRDPRIHYAVNCASVGCPNLGLHPYVADQLHVQLEGAARQFINSEKGVSSRDNKLLLSSIYTWFAADFGGEAGVLQHLQQYAGDATLRVLQLQQNGIIYDYDWSLNDMPGASRLNR